MRNVTYSLICEDEAHKLFIEAVIKNHKHADITFTFNNTFYQTLFCRSSKDVKNKLAQAANYSFLHQQGFYCDVIFVGIDYDDRNRTNFANELDKLYEKINTHARSKVLIFFPVQAIEHWLILLKERQENPDRSKNIASEVEAINRATAKSRLYPHKKQPKNIIINPIVEDADFEWLATTSVSFRNFYNKFNSFLLNNQYR